MNIRIFAILACIAVLFAQCNKQSAIITPPGNQEEFTLTVKNEFNELQAHYAVYLSDEDGKVVAFRWLPGDDTARIVVQGAANNARYDCTLAKIVVIDASGSGLRDTAISLTTYTRIASGETINLRDLNYKQNTDLRVQFTGITSLDSIIVSDGLTFSRPQQANSFIGQYRVEHTGKIWLRIRINGEDKWRFMLFENVNSENLEATIDATLLPTIFSHPKDIALPFVAAWQYKIDGVVDLAALRFFPLGDLLRAPGGAIPVFNNINVFEPVINDVFNPEPKPYGDFRVQVKGAGSPPDAYTYFSDRIYPELPAQLPVPSFDLLASPLSNNRYTAANTSGSVDLLSFTRSRAGTPSLSWEVLAAPVTSGFVTYRLPDLPKELADLSLSLKLYDFGNAVQVRGEAYDQYQGYEQVISQHLQNDDPLWQAKAGYTGKAR